MQTDRTRKLFTVDEYHRMAEAGIFGPGDHVELIDGDIVQMSPMGSRHASCVIRATEVLVGELRGRAIVSPQIPLDLNTYTEPQPDIALLRTRTDFYASRLPGSGDVLLVIEVSDTSLRFDRDVKVPLYASAGVPEVWILDLTRDQIVVCRDPSGDEYGWQRSLSRGERISVAAFPGVVFGVDQLLG